MFDSRRGEWKKGALTFRLTFDLVDSASFVETSGTVLKAKKESNPTYSSLHCPPCASGIAKRGAGGAIRTRSYRGRAVVGKVKKHWAGVRSLSGQENHNAASAGKTRTVANIGELN